MLFYCGWIWNFAMNNGTKKKRECTGTPPTRWTDMLFYCGWIWNFAMNNGAKKKKENVQELHPHVGQTSKAIPFSLLIFSVDANLMRKHILREDVRLHQEVILKTARRGGLSSVVGVVSVVSLQSRPLFHS